MARPDLNSLAQIEISLVLCSKSMTVWMRRFSYVMPLLFAGLIALLFFREFEGNERVEWEVSEIRLSAHTLAPNAHRDGQVRSLSVATDGFVVDLSRGSGIVRRSDSGRASILNPIDFREREGGFIVELEDGYALEILREPGDRLAIQLAIAKPAERERVRSYEFSFRAAEGAQFRRTDNSPVLEIQVGDRIYNLLLPESALFDAVNRRIILAPEPDTQTIRYVFEPEPDAGTIATWARSGELSLNSADYEAILDAFASDLVDSWNARFSPAAGTWQRPEGAAVFDERIAAALMSRAWGSTAYDLRAAELRNAASIHASARSFRTAPYFGDLNRLAPAMREELRSQETDLRALVAGDPVELLHTSDAILRMNISSILTRIADDALTSAAHDAIEGLSVTDLDIPDAIRILELLYRESGVSDDLRQILSAFEQASVDRITEAVRRTPSGFYVESQPGTVEFEHTVRAGLAFAAFPGDNRVQQLGRHLVRDALELADDQLTLPRTGALTQGAVETLSGYLLPEEWYHFLRPQPQAVRMTPLPAPFDEGAFLLSAVRLADVRATTGQVVVELENVPNRTHYIVMQEVPSFRNMELFRLDWRTDPNFENFSRGRNFNSSAGTLKIKYTDTQPTGRIVLTL